MRKMVPTTYVLEEYEPKGMEGILITEAKLAIQIGSDGDPYVDSISLKGKFPFDFIDQLIHAMHNDVRLMLSIEEECCVEYERNAY